MTATATKRFDGRVVLITGAARGLGRAYALAYAERGARVVVNDLPQGEESAAGVERLAQELRARGASALAVPASVLDADLIVARTLSEFGRLDVLVNNAGMLRDAAFHKMTAAQWDEIHEVHLKGAFLMTRAAWPHMRASNYGRIVMTTSCAGLYGNFGQANYAAAKSGLVGLAQSLAIEGVRHGIRVNVIAPLADSRLTAGIFPPNLSERLDPAHLVPLVMALTHESCERTGQVFESGGGYAWRVRWQRSAVLDLRAGHFDDSSELDQFDERREIAGVADSMSRVERELERETPI